MAVMAARVVMAPVLWPRLLAMTVPQVVLAVTEVLAA
jgi:hypothetical protein